MPHTPTWTFGRFVWHEILTPDIRRSQAFYSELLGWKYQTFAGGGDRYEMILVNGLPQGGLMSTASVASNDGPALVMGYVSVPDVDAAARAGTESGGALCVAPFEVPSVGRLAVLADAGGASFSVMRSAGGDGPLPGRPGPGQFCWHQLNTADPVAASRYYRAALGWRSRALTEGDPVEVFVHPAESGDARTASFVPAPPGGTSHWLSFVAVDDLPAARGRAVRLGAQVLVEHLAVPGIGAAAVLRDVLGATIGLMAWA